MATIDISELYSTGGKQFEFIGRTKSSAVIGSTNPLVITPPDADHFVMLSFLAPLNADTRTGYIINDGKRNVYNNISITDRGYIGTSESSSISIGRQWIPRVYSDTTAYILSNAMQTKPPVKGCDGLPLTVTRVDTTTYFTTYEYEVYKYV